MLRRLVGPFDGAGPLGVLGWCVFFFGVGRPQKRNVSAAFFGFGFGFWGEVLNVSYFWAPSLGVFSFSGFARGDS